MELVAPGVVLNRDPGDIGLPFPAPLYGIEALANHVGAYFGRRRHLTWTSFQIGEGYQVATLSERADLPVTAFISERADIPVTAFICAVDHNHRLTRVDHITCPKRLSMLLKLCH
jgi:hypothetical protein